MIHVGWVRVGGGSWFMVVGWYTLISLEQIVRNCSLTIRLYFQVTHHALGRTATFPVSSILLSQRLNTLIFPICVYIIISIGLVFYTYNFHGLFFFDVLNSKDSFTV